MKKLILMAGMATVLGACGSQKGADSNPFLSEYNTPFEVPPFDKIQLEHYKPAFMQGMEEEAKEVEAIANNPEAATFENTIVALDQSGKLIRKVSSVFYGQNSADTSDEMQEISR